MLLTLYINIYIYIYIYIKVKGNACYLGHAFMFANMLVNLAQTLGDMLSNSCFLFAIKHSNARNVFFLHQTRLKNFPFPT